VVYTTRGVQGFDSRALAALAALAAFTGLRTLAALTDGAGRSAPLQPCLSSPLSPGRKAALAAAHPAIGVLARAAVHLEPAAAPSV
jgi:hypothetical protein